MPTDLIVILLIYAAVFSLVLLSRLLHRWDSHYPDSPFRFHYHRWVYGNRVRLCERCKEIQYLHQDMEGQSAWSPNPPECERCFGTGKVLNHFNAIERCPECDGTGHE